MERCKDVRKDEIMGFLARFSVDNMADGHGRKWDRCLADTAVKTGQKYYFIYTFAVSI